MSETLRDLVVSLSLNSDNFTRNIKSINKQIQEAESAFYHFYRRNGEWRMNAVANGYNAPLRSLCQSYGRTVQ